MEQGDGGVLQGHGFRVTDEAADLLGDKGTRAAVSAVAGSVRHSAVKQLWWNSSFIFQLEEENLL